MAGVGSCVGEEVLEEANALPDDDETAAVAIGEGFEEDAVDDREEGSGGSDAEGQSENGGEGEAGGLAELAEAVTQVLQDRVHRVTSRILFVKERYAGAGDLFGDCAGWGALNLWIRGG